MGGKERRLTELLRAIQRQPSFQVELVLLSQKVDFPQVFTLGIPIHYITRRSRKDWRTFQQLLRICRRFRPDIIHSWESMCSVLAVPAALYVGARLVNGMITNVPTRLRFMSKPWVRSRLTFPFSDAVVANSRAGLRAYRAPRRRSYFIPNGFDPARLEHLTGRSELRAKFGLERPHVVGMVASCSSNKDYRSFLSAARLVLKARRDVTFVAVGGGPLIEELRSRAADLEPAGFQFTGQQSDVESIINLFDVGVLMTNSHLQAEGLSNSIMEYMALGKPVVASLGGGTEEIVTHGQTGFLIPAGDARQLAEKILFLLEHPRAAATMGAAGRHRIFTEFSLDKMTERYAQLYRSCLLPAVRKAASKDQFNAPAQ